MVWKKNTICSGGHQMLLEVKPQHLPCKLGIDWKVLVFVKTVAANNRVLPQILYLD
jgi:hypothetical protein